MPTPCRSIAVRSPRPPHRLFTESSVPEIKKKRGAGYYTPEENPRRLISPRRGGYLYARYATLRDLSRCLNRPLNVISTHFCGRKSREGILEILLARAAFSTRCVISSGSYISSSSTRASKYFRRCSFRDTKRPVECYVK